MIDKIIDILVIGSGPAGWSAAIYAARGMKDTYVICGDQPGGQLTITTDVENYPGFADIIQGPWLMDQMKQQAEKVGVNIVYEHVESINFANEIFTCKTNGNQEFKAKSIIISTGASARWLGLESEKKYMGYGVSGCATCDAFFYKNKEVAVVGGGNTAVEEALHLTHYASKVYLIHRRNSLRAENILQERILSNDKIEFLWHHQLEEVLGNDEFVTGMKLFRNDTNETYEKNIDGIFIAIGHTPNTSIFKDFITLDSEGYIITTPGTTRTNIAGVFAAGDVQDKIYRQAITAAGTGCMAALDAMSFLNASS